MHVIKQTAFEVFHHDRGDVTELQNTVSSLCRNRLTDQMTALFDTFANDKKSYRIDAIAIDIGPIALEDLETDLCDRIVDRLKEALLKHFADSNEHKSEEDVIDGNPTPGKAEVLEYFLLTGILPWYAANDTNPETILAGLLNSFAAGLREIITRIGSKDTVRARIVRQFSEKSIKNIISLLDPANAEYIFEYHAETVRIQEENQIVKTDIREFKTSVWYFILTYLLVDRGSYFNRKEFVRNNIQQLSAHYNISYTDLLHILAQALDLNNPVMRDNGLPSIINELQNEHATELAEKNRLIERNGKRDETESEFSLAEKSRVLEHFLVYGSLPWWIGQLHREQLSEYLVLLITAVPAHVREIITNTGKDKGARDRIANTFEEKVIRKVVTVIEPDNDAIIFEYADKVQIGNIAGDYTEFRKAVWKFILDFLLAEKGSTFNTRTFVKRNLEALARHYGTHFEVLLDIFSQTIINYTNGSGTERFLFSIVNDIRTEYYGKNDAVTDSALQEKRAEADDARDEYYGKNEVANDGVLTDSILRDSILQEKPAERDDTSKERYGKNETVKGSTLQESQTEQASYDSEKAWEETGNAENRQQTEQALAGALTELLLQWLLTGSLPWWGATGGLASLGATADYFPGGTYDPVYFDEYGTASLQQARRNMGRGSFRIIAAHMRGAYVYRWHSSRQGPFTQPETLAFSSKGPASAASSLLKRLLAKAPGEALKVLRLAGLAATTQRRFVYGVEKKIQHGIFSLLSFGAEALKAIEEMAELFEKRLNLSTSAKGQLSHELLLLLWQQLVKNNYDRFDKDDLIRESLRQLHVILNVPATTVAEVFMKAGMIHDGGNQKTSQHNEVEQYFSSTSPLTHAELITRSLEVLRYFLTYGSLPPSIKQHSAAGYQYLVIKELLLLLHAAQSTSVANMLSNSQYKIEAKIMLLDLFRYATDHREKAVASVLYRHSGEYFIHYIKNSSTKLSGRHITGNLLSILKSDITGNEGQLRTYLSAMAALPNREIVIGFIEGAMKHSSFTSYLVKHFTDQEVYTLLTNTGTGWGNETVSFMKETDAILYAAAGDMVSRDKLTWLLREFKLMYISGKVSVSGSAAYIRELFKFLLAGMAFLGSSVVYVLLTTASRRFSGVPAISSYLSEIAGGLPKQVGEAFNAVSANYRQQPIESTASSTTDVTQAQRQQKIAAELKNIDGGKETEAIRAREKENMEQLVENIYIDNAGLVLLHPFLGTYFDRLGMLQAGKFISDESHMRGAHLLQYLVFGTEGDGEHKMALNKLILGIPFDMPLPGAITITEKEKEVSAQLLGAILHNWDKLKNTSVDGLRTSFLQRDGILFHEKDEWTLRVDQRGYDVLLQTLPWGIGMIKTSWMTQFLYVQWI